MGLSAATIGSPSLNQTFSFMIELISHIRQGRRVLLLFSGGLDSSLLLALGRQTLSEGRDKAHKPVHLL
jgi:asparagine synthetase B (glutamine-hydrolysing)